MNKENWLFKNPDIEPTAEFIAEGLGGANKAFVDLAGGLKQFGITLMDWRYYKDGNAWLTKGEYKWTTARGASKVKPIFWLSMWEGYFKVAFYFAYSIRDELLNLPISGEAKEIINNAKPMGKTMRFLPLVFDIENEMLLNDIYVIAEFRKVKIK